jgi:Protein of unknown function (DUF2934)
MLVALPASKEMSMATISTQHRTPFTIGIKPKERILEETDPAERHQLISEAAYERYMQRGYCDGYDVDDWLEAEAEIDDRVFNSKKERV